MVDEMKRPTRDASTANASSVGPRRARSFACPRMVFAVALLGTSLGCPVGTGTSGADAGEPDQDLGNGLTLHMTESTWQDGSVSRIQLCFTVTNSGSPGGSSAPFTLTINTGWCSLGTETCPDETDNVGARLGDNGVTQGAGESIACGVNGATVSFSGSVTPGQNSLTCCSRTTFGAECTDAPWEPYQMTAYFGSPAVWLQGRSRCG